jgi:hypothetical protein
MKEREENNMTNVTYTFTDNTGKKRTTASYAEMTKYISKGSRPDVVYTPIVEDYPIPEERKRIKL